MNRIRIEYRCYEEERTQAEQGAARRAMNLSEYHRWLVEQDARQALVGTIYPQRRHVRTIASK